MTEDYDRGRKLLWRKDRVRRGFRFERLRHGRAVCRARQDRGRDCERDYFLGNTPIKFYEYRKNRIEISNPGGLFGRAKPDNFPFVNDYRNPLLAEAMKVLGVVNKYNRGITKANRELEKNGNPPAQFDVNKQTEFRVTVLARSESGQIKWQTNRKVAR